MEEKVVDYCFNGIGACTSMWKSGAKSCQLAIQSTCNFACITYNGNSLKAQTSEEKREMNIKSDIIFLYWITSFVDEGLLPAVPVQPS